MRILTVCSFVATLVLLSPVAANAAGKHPKAEAFKQACAEDAKKFCSNEKPGEGAVAKCLAGHIAELSPQCSHAVYAAHEKLGEFKQACGADAKKLCPGMKPGGGRIMECLKTNEAQLSPTCQAAMSKAHGGAATPAAAPAATPAAPAETPAAPAATPAAPAETPAAPPAPQPTTK